VSFLRRGSRSYVTSKLGRAVENIVVVIYRRLGAAGVKASDFVPNQMKIPTSRAKDAREMGHPYLDQAPRLRAECRSAFFEEGRDSSTARPFAQNDNQRVKIHTHRCHISFIPC
jgi:hypothetical protein